MFKEKFNINKFVEGVKDGLKEQFSKERQCLESIKNDKEFLTEEEKEEVLDMIVNRGWGVESALEHYLGAKYAKEMKHALVEELFPEVYNKIKKEKS